MELEAMLSQARHVTKPYQERDLERFGRPWNLNELVLGFVGDVGELARLG